MRRETNILILACLLTVIAPLTAQSQTQLPDEKRKGMHKLDPSDVLLEPQDRRRRKGRERRSILRDAGPVLGTSSVQETPSGRSAGDIVSAATPTPSPTPSVTPTVTPEITPSPTTTTAESAATPAVLSASQPSVPPSNPTTADKVGGMAGLSITVIVTLLGLILLALIFALVKLKNQLRSP